MDNDKKLVESTKEFREMGCEPREAWKCAKTEERAIKQLNCQIARCNEILPFQKDD